MPVGRVVPFADDGSDAASPRDAVNLQQLNAAIAGIGTQSDLGTPQAQAATEVFLTQSSPTVQLIDIISSFGS
jgi:hypothetical protein